MDIHEADTNPMGTPMVHIGDTTPMGDIPQTLVSGENPTETWSPPTTAPVFSDREWRVINAAVNGRFENNLKNDGYGILSPAAEEVRDAALDAYCRINFTDNEYWALCYMRDNGVLPYRRDGGRGFEPLSREADYTKWELKRFHSMKERQKGKKPEKDPMENPFFATLYFIAAIFGFRF